MRIQQAIQESIQVKQQILADTTLLDTIQKAVDAIVGAYKNNHRVFFCGNGGSAADAQHLAAELSGRFYFDRPSLSAEALHCNTSYLTAVSNDYGYDDVYARLMQGTAVKGDVLIGLSTSGNSVNILKAFDVAISKEITTIALTGLSGGKLKSKANYLLQVPSEDTARIQESHILMGHIICELVEAKLFEKK